MTPSSWRSGPRPATWPTPSPTPACASASCRATCGAGSSSRRCPTRRGGLYVGTGGPGHLDPRRNDGGDGSQGIVESPAWESPLFALFDAIHAHPDAALIGVCHTFGVMSRWLGVADPVLRGPEKGGKSAGIVDSVLTPASAAHPWFGGLAHGAADEPGHAGRIRVLDSRLYDLLPRPIDGRAW